MIFEKLTDSSPRDDREKSKEELHVLELTRLQEKWKADSVHYVG